MKNNSLRRLSHYFRREGLDYSKPDASQQLHNYCDSRYIYPINGLIYSLIGNMYGYWTVESGLGILAYLVE